MRVRVVCVCGRRESAVGARPHPCVPRRAQGGELRRRHYGRRRRRGGALRQQPNTTSCCNSLERCARSKGAPRGVIIGQFCAPRVGQARAHFLFNYQPSQPRVFRPPDPTTICVLAMPTLSADLSNFENARSPPRGVAAQRDLSQGALKQDPHSALLVLARRPELHARRQSEYLAELDTPHPTAIGAGPGSP